MLFLPPAALSDGSVAAADRLQRSLMVDYPGECGAWMPGIRQLIAQLSPPADAAPADTPAEAPAPSEASAAPGATAADGGDS